MTHVFRITILLSHLLLIFLLSACTQEKPRNVILISLDTLRADRLGCYDFHEPTSPCLDKFAQENTLFEVAVAQSPWTLPSHASLFTGLFPHKAGVVSQDHSLSSEIPTIASMLKDKGFRTAGFVNSSWIKSETGLDQGFDDFKFFKENLEDVEEKITNDAVSWLEKNKGNPFFLFVHYYTTHSDYTPDPAFYDPFVKPYKGIANGTTRQMQRFRKGKVFFDKEDIDHNSNLYNAEIRQLDSALDNLFKNLKKLNLMENSLVVVTADHGEEFLEHGGVLHGKSLYSEVLRIPLIMGGPGLPKGRRIQTPVMLTDIVPTILNAVGIPFSQTFDGENLFPVMSGEKDLSSRFVFAAADKKNNEIDILRMVRNERYKLCYNRLTGEKELYDLKTDPGEKRNIILEHHHMANKMMLSISGIMKHKRKAKQAPPKSKEELKRLEELGY